MIGRTRGRDGKLLYTAFGALIGLVIFTVFVVYVLPWKPRPRAPAGEALPSAERRADWSVDACAACHLRATPGIVDQWAESKHGRRGVTCRSCHEVPADNPYAIEHVGTHVTTTVTPRICGQCHENAYSEFEISHHSLPSWAALTGTDDFKDDPALMAIWDRIKDRPYNPQGFVLPTRNLLFDLEGPQVTPLACEECHGVGQPNLDGSAGSCSKCHLRHRFNLEQVRRPETCNNCHIGPDHPQWEIYEESAHGIIYHTMESHFNFDQVPGRLGVDDFPSPTCQICHMAGFGGQPTTHNVGLRLSWFLYMPISEHRPDHEKQREAMRSICRQCHSTEFIDRQFQAADSVVEWTNARVTEANQIISDLMNDGLVPREQFTNPLQFLAFDLWHFYGRTAKFGAFMQGADYTQWHGAYPLLRELNDLRARAQELRSRGPTLLAGPSQP
jgi:hydroxylamine dehydrogenase